MTMPDAMPDAMLNTNKPPSAQDVVEFLKQFPPGWFVRAYEGEGGSWIIVNDDST
jgi:hypothetical protein